MLNILQTQVIKLYINNYIRIKLWMDCGGDCNVKNFNSTVWIQQRNENLQSGSLNNIMIF